MAALFKRDNNSTSKNVALNTKNTAIDIFYSRMFKTQLLLPTLSCVVKKRGFILS